MRSSGMIKSTGNSMLRLVDSVLDGNVAGNMLRSARTQSAPALSEHSEHHRRGAPAIVVAESRSTIQGDARRVRTARRNSSRAHQESIAIKWFKITPPGLFASAFSLKIRKSAPVDVEVSQSCPLEDSTIHYTDITIVVMDQYLEEVVHLVGPTSEPRTTLIAGDLDRGTYAVLLFSHAYRSGPSIMSDNSFELTAYADCKLSVKPKDVEEHQVDVLDHALVDLAIARGTCQTVQVGEHCTVSVHQWQHGDAFTHVVSRTSDATGRSAHVVGSFDFSGSENAAVLGMDQLEPPSSLELVIPGEDESQGVLVATLTRSERGAWKNNAKMEFKYDPSRHPS